MYIEIGCDPSREKVLSHTVGSRHFSAAELTAFGWLYYDVEYRSET